MQAPAHVPLASRESGKQEAGPPSGGLSVLCCGTISNHHQAKVTFGPISHSPRASTMLHAAARAMYPMASNHLQPWHAVRNGDGPQAVLKTLLFL